MAVVDPFLAATRAAVAGEYEVLGELDHSEEGVRLYLARTRDSDSLILLKLDTAEAGEEFTLDVITALDASVPDIEAACPACQSVLRRWARFCHRCGLDVSGVGPLEGSSGRDELLAAVQEAAAGEYQILGEMPRAEGGGMVYFARDLATDKVVALRLQQAAGDEYELGVTRVLKNISQPAAAGGADAATPTVVLRQAGGAPPASRPRPAPPAAVQVGVAESAAGPSIPPAVVVSGIVLVVVVLVVLLLAW